MPRRPYTMDPRRPLTRGQSPYDLGSAKPGAIETTKPETGGLEALARQTTSRPYSFTSDDWTDIANKAYTAGDPSNWWEEEYTKQRPIHYMPGEGGARANEIRTNALIAGIPRSMEIADKMAIGSKGIEVSRLMKKIEDFDSNEYQNIIRAWTELKNKLSSGDFTGYQDAAPAETAARIIMKRFNLAQGGRAGFADGGRPGYQAGTSVTQIRPEQFIQDIGTDYARQLAATTAVPLQTSQFAPAVAQQTGLQQQATQDVTAGLGAYQPYLTGAGAAGVTAPGATAMGAQAYAGLGQAAGLTGTGAGTGAGSIASYMSPYQSQVIDTSLAEFDRQAQMRQQGISDAAVQVGGYGGGREGVMQAEYQTQSDKNRAMLQAGLQQQGYTQAQGARQQDYLNQMGLQQAQQGLGSYQAGLGAATQQQLGADVGMAGRVGSANQAQAQAELDAMREANRMAAYEPIERLGMYGTGVTGLMGGYPGQYQSTVQPGPTPLQSALGIASVAGGLYGNIYGPQRPKFA